MTKEEFLTRVVQSLECASIPFMVAGSIGSSYYGQPRATNDVDIVIDPSREQLDLFLAGLGKEYYADSESAHHALQTRSMFNIIDFSEGMKADLIVRKDRPFSVEEFKRRKSAEIEGQQIPMASAEDIILTKLEWNQISESERQIRDALNVAIEQWPRLDQEYLRKWAPQLGVVADLEKLLESAKASQASRKS